VFAGMQNNQKYYLNFGYTASLNVQ